MPDSTTAMYHGNCDKCGRPITGNKGYSMINGWIICGICEFEMNLSVKQTDIDPEIQEAINKSFWDMI